MGPMTPAAYVAEDGPVGALLDINGRIGLGPWEGCMPQCRGMPGQRVRSGWVGEPEYRRFSEAKPGKGLTFEM